MFSMRETERVYPVRHMDLQRFFRQINFEIPKRSQPWIQELSRTFDALKEALPNESRLLRNRGISISAVLFAWQRQMYENKKTLASYAQFPFSSGVFAGS